MYKTVSWYILYFFLLVVISLFIFPHRTHDQVQSRLTLLMVKFDQVCQAHDVTYWMIGGTLLGSERERDMIAWDDDADVAMPPEDRHRLTSPELTRALATAGLRLDPMTRSPHRICDKIRWLHTELWTPSEEFIDIFEMDRVSDGTDRWMKTSATARRLWPQCWFYEDELFPLKRQTAVQWCDGGKKKVLQMNCPHDPVGFLARHYGSTWKVPVHTHSHTLGGLKQHLYFPFLLTTVIMLMVYLACSLYERKKHPQQVRVLTIA